MHFIEIDSIDIRFSHARHKNPVVERKLIDSIRARGILDALQGVPEGNSFVLLDGFKRYRCARKLSINQIPVEYIGTDTVSGLLFLLRRSVASGVTAIEQSALIEELHNKYGLSIYEIAVQLDRSPSWVSVRFGMIEQLSPLVKEKIMSGAFPVRAYLYGLKGFTRVHKISSGEIDACVESLSGKRLSTRDLYILTRAYFKGAEAIRNLITDGDVHQALRILKNTQAYNTASFSSQQLQCIENCRSISSTIDWILRNDPRKLLTGAEFSNEINVWCTALLRSIGPFHDIIRELYERTGSSVGCVNDVPAGT